MAEESIYNIVYVEPEEPQRPARHTSKYPGTGKPTGSTFSLMGTSKPGVGNLGGDLLHSEAVGVGAHKYEKANATFGKLPTQAMPEPGSFLRQGAKNGKVSTLRQVKATNPAVLKPSALKPKCKPPLPGPGDAPIMNLVSGKNFIVANAVEAILAAPKKSSDEDMDFLNKEDYGNVPAYLVKIKEDIEAEYDYIRQLRQEAADAATSHRSLTADEKETLILGLKAKWETVNREYQQTTHLTKLDTLGKMKRKLFNESVMTDIEKSIDKLKKSNIMVDLNA